MLTLKMITEETDRVIRGLEKLSLIHILSGVACFRSVSDRIFSRCSLCQGLTIKSAAPSFRLLMARSISA